MGTASITRSRNLTTRRAILEGNVELANRHLHQINLIPAPAHYDFTLTEHKIVMAAIVFLQREGLLEHQCHRSVDEKLLPGVKLLDYAQVAKVQIKRLKPVVRFIMNLKLPDVTETSYSRHPQTRWNAATTGTCSISVVIRMLG